MLRSTEGPRDAVLERALDLVMFGEPLQGPELPAGLVPRPELIARLRDPRDAGVVVVEAPAGYGKTTLLTQWANEDERPFGWLSVSRGDNDATMLLAYLALVLNAMEPLDERSFVGLSMSGADLTSVLLPRLREALEGRLRPFVLVLDDVHLLQRDEPMSVLGALVQHMPHGSQLVLAGRSAPPLPLARSRVSRRLLTIGPEDLAMTAAEGTALLQAEGIQLSAAVGDALVGRTEGWPAGIYLAALALREQADPEAGAKRFAGDDPLIDDYLREEVLAIPAEELDFLLGTSVLDQLCGPLCDAVLDATGSADKLEGLRRSNRFVVGLDRRGQWYRYHHLFQDMLRAHLHRREPGREEGLHARASVWLEQAGDVAGAIRHARAAGDAPRGAALLWSNAPRYLSDGRTTTVTDWLEPFTPDEIDAMPTLALTKAWWCLNAADTEAIEHWTSLAERAGPHETLPDGMPLRSATLLLRAVIGTEGITGVRDHAAQAFELNRPGTYWRPIARFLEGAALRLLGERELARTRLEEGAHLAQQLVPATRAQCIGQLALLAIHDDDWSRADELVDDARRLIDEFALSERPPMVQVYATSALSLARRGSINEAQADLRHGLWLLEMIRNVGPWFVAESMLLLARTSHLLGNVATARMLTREAEAALDGYADAGTLLARLEDFERRILASSASVGLAAAPLTPAEMRVLRYLPTHLSFAAIAEELFVSRSTVKTQAVAVYRKLGVSSRALAVAQADELGLLEQ